MKKAARLVTRYIRWIFLSALSGVLAGLSAAAFLILLDWVTSTRKEHLALIWGLPLAGLLIGLIYHHFGRGVDRGQNLILDEIHDPKKVIPARMTPFVLFSTLLTHLCGGSAGREGTAVQMGASLSDQLTYFFQVEPDERKILLVTGAGAGFGAAIGAPWAGVIFGMEVIAVGRLRLFAWLECLVASFVGYYTADLVGARHSVFPKYEVAGFDLKTAAFVALAGVVVGLAIMAFVKFTHLIEHVFACVIKFSPLRPVVSGVLLIALFRLEGSYRYAGLGIEEIQHAMRAHDNFSVPALKGFFTALTIGTGFKGGEFIPLVFVGSTLGSALAAFVPVSIQLLACVGFAAAFAGASNTPIACSIMAVELFGPHIAPYAVIGCFMSYYSSGHQGIYKSQRIHARKHQRIVSLLSWLGELPKRFVNGSIPPREPS